MPLLKSAKTPETPAAPATTAPAPVASAPAIAEAKPTDVSAKLRKLDEKDRKILLQGQYQAALHSVGVVQHGGKSFADYLNRVEEAANAGVAYVLKNL